MEIVMKVVTAIGTMALGLVTIIAMVMVVSWVPKLFEKYVEDHLIGLFDRYPKTSNAILMTLFLGFIGLACYGAGILVLNPNAAVAP